MKLELDYAYPAGSNIDDIAASVSGETDTLVEVILAVPSHLEPVPCCAATRASLRGGFSVSQMEAMRQHRELQRALERWDVRCRLLPAEPDLADLCFTRDAAVTTPWGLLGLNPALPHRAREVDYLLQFARNAGIPIFDTLRHGTAEGGDICIARPGLIFIGCSGERTSEEGARSIAAMFEAAGWDAVIYHFDPHFLHLDTQFCMVRPDLALACTDVLSDAFLAKLDGFGIETIAVSYKEAMQLGCNILAVGQDRILSSLQNDRVNSLLRDRGLDVQAVDISQFTRCGGGIHCLTMPLLRQAVR
ncbi:dimethylarginine dimethylaminohydrolase family protein [Sphingomonas sp.]|uniref:dimethylarginine dimethylaminohydrolase family protein n=1 Tax=Sphingomonas sp. TaxID=28214 RepID=UPI003B3BA844